MNHGQQILLEKIVNIRDLFYFDIIYIQNRILDNAFSDTLNRFNKNFSLFITSSKNQYNYILSSGLGYNKNNVVVTGLSRCDNLIELSKIIKKEKVILISPSWRNFIGGTRDLVTYDNIYSDKFKNTTFFKFYNKFINEPKFISILRKFNYTGIFCLHPYFSKQSIDFTSNYYIKIKEKCDYQKLLVSSSLLITDYSNIFYDFGYLKKPIIYLHFDIDEYKKYNTKGYFNYEKDGFGLVCFEFQCVIDELVTEIKNECKIRKKYLKRINKFFSFLDKNNNDRIYHEIIKKNNNQNFISIIFYINLFILSLNPLYINFLKTMFLFKKQFQNF